VRCGGQDPVGGELFADVLDGVFAGGDAGGPEVGDGDFVVAHPRQGGWWADGGDASEPFGSFFGRAAGFPECLAPGEPEAIEYPGGSESLDLGGREPGTPYKVCHARLGPVLVAFFHDSAGDVVADGLDPGQPETDGEPTVAATRPGSATATGTPSPHYPLKRQPAR
jgi:hypothetical protein